MSRNNAKGLWTTVLKAYLVALGASVGCFILLGLLVPGIKWYIPLKLYILFGLPIILVAFILISVAGKSRAFLADRGSMRIALPLLLHALPSFAVAIAVEELFKALLRLGYFP